MLKPSRALRLNADSGRRLPRVPVLEPLYEYGMDPRHGQVIMIVGRSGSQKSGFALWWVDEMNLDTLYFSADMSAFTASSRIACKRTGLTTEEVEQAMDDPREREMISDALADSRITFSFGSPITWRQIDEELDAYVELHNKWPEVLVFDNLMDFEGGAESDYTAQMAVMQGLTELSRYTGSTVIVMHHASDKAMNADSDPGTPPSRREVKGGLSEKPELSLSVALDPNSMAFRVAVIKQRSGPCDPSARRLRQLRCEPALTRFHRWESF